MKKSRVPKNVWSALEKISDPVELAERAYAAGYRKGRISKSRKRKKK